MKDIILDEELIKLTGKRKDRQDKLRDSMNSLYEDTRNKDLMREELNRNSENVFKEEINMNLRKESVEEMKCLNESAMLESDMVEDLFADFLCEAVVASLNIDKDLVAHNRAYTDDKVKAFFKATKGLMKFDNNVASEVVNSFKQATKRDTKKDIGKKEEAGFAKAYSHLEPLSMVVKEKVAKVIEEEKIMADLESQLEENIYAHDVDVRMTLFREMQIENVKEAVKEAEEAGKEIVNEDIMLISFYETVVDYTMLEVFNTLELLEFKEDNYTANKTRRYKSIF